MRCAALGIARLPTRGTHSRRTTWVCPGSGNSSLDVRFVLEGRQRGQARRPRIAGPFWIAGAWGRSGISGSRKNGLIRNPALRPMGSTMTFVRSGAAAVAKGVVSLHGRARPIRQRLRETSAADGALLQVTVYSATFSAREPEWARAPEASRDWRRFRERRTRGPLHRPDGRKIGRVAGMPPGAQ